MNITATSEKNPQSIFLKKVYAPENSSWWWGLRVVAWISQDKANLKTTLYFKWQQGSFNYWPYWLDSHSYSVTAAGSSKSSSFNLTQNRSNTWVDKTSAQSVEINHNSETGEATFSMTFTGYVCWEAFNYSEGGYTVPTIDVTPDPSPQPQPTPEESVQYTNDLDPKYYILADEEVIYSLTDEDFYLINPKLTLELNQTDSLTFTMPPSHFYYDKLNKLKTTVEVRQGSEVLFRGRVLHDDVDFYNRKEVYCEGALSFLGDTIMFPYAEGDYKTAKDFFKAAIDKHTELVPNSTPKRKLKYVKCNVSSDITVSNDDYSYTSDVISKLLDDVGGYLKLEYYPDGSTGISYLNSTDHTSSQIVDFGENILDLTQYIDASDIYTSVVCLGAKDENTGKRLTTGSDSAMYVEDADSIATFGRIIRTFTYDDITNQNELRGIATVLLIQGIRQSITIEIKAIDLHILYPEIEKIRVGDYARLRSTPHKIDSFFQCSKIDLDMQNPENTTYTFGATLKALTDTTSKK